MKANKNPILPVLAFCTNDAVLAEQWLDFVFLQNGRKPHGCVLLVCAGDVHEELQARVKIAAQVAFETVELLRSSHLATNNKHAAVNHQFRTAAEHVQKTYRLPWLWLEPDVVPLKPGWLQAIASSYYGQSKRYCGSWLKSHNLFLARIAVYPPDAFTDLAAFFAGPNHGMASAPFNWAAGDTIIPRSTKTRLVQEAGVTFEDITINEDAVMLHHDKNAIKLTELRMKLEGRMQNEAVNI